MHQEIVQSKKISMAGTSLANAAFSMPGGRSYGQHMNNSTNNRSSFQMPLHYPRYKKKDYENMPEWKLDRLLNEYGLPVSGDVDQKRKFAMGAFLWPSQEE
ncbi:uncharacterized protein LOC115754706 [Rhodamnia argentea]|uniref:Uncharacterized protein LOC115754706 n=1 Tax=Rhodamnia argentea TaxID=178133 RepID=A0A8B8QRP0_9MYRT|nr:uncharacterized protein LOC115754706 [Rhodamnia argentea]